MARLTIRRLDDETNARLRVRAASNGRSMEAEACAILSAALADRPAVQGLATAIRRRFAPLGGVDLDLPAREPMPAPVKRR